MSDRDVERVVILIANAMFPGKVTDYPDFDPVEMLARLNAAARAALSAMPHAALMREALEALEPFAAEYEYWVTDIPEQLMLSDGNGTLSPADIKWDAIVRARAAAQRLRDALTQEKQT